MCTALGLFAADDRPGRVLLAGAGAAVGSVAILSAAGWGFGRLAVRLHRGQPLRTRQALGIVALLTTVAAFGVGMGLFLLLAPD